MGWITRLRGRGWSDNARVLVAEAEAERAKAEASVEQAKTRRAELAVGMRQLAFEGARRSNQFSDWRTPGSDADAAAGASRAMLRFRVRDLIRNEPSAAKGQMVLVAHGVGTGIRPRPTSASDAFNELLSRRFSDWARREAAVDGVHSFWSLQAQAFGAMLADGECIIRMVDAPKSLGLAIPLQLVVMEADHLDTAKSAKLKDGEIVQGVEKNGYGRIVAYWLFESHPGRGVAPRESIRIPADDIIHLFDARRPGAMRGWSHYSAVITALRAIGDYNGAELMKQKIAALFGIIATLPEDDQVGDTMGSAVEDAYGNKLEDMNPGLVAYAKAGTTITALNPPSTQNHESFIRTQDRRVAAGFGITYAQLTGDLTQTSFSSTRAGMNEFWAWMDQLRAMTLIEMFCARVWDRWVKVQYDAGTLAAQEAPCEWTVPARPVISPVEEAAARLSALRQGVSTLGMETGKRGDDLRTILKERAREKALLDQLGLVFDSSPWDMSVAGQFQVGAEANAEDPNVLDGNRDAGGPLRVLRNG